MLKDTFNFKLSATPSEFLARFKNYDGPTMNAFEAARKSVKGAGYGGNSQALFTDRQSGSNNTTFIRDNCWWLVSGIDRCCRSGRSLNQNMRLHRRSGD